jgi:hypothetical protein
MMTAAILKVLKTTSELRVRMRVKPNPNPNSNPMKL